MPWLASLLVLERLFALRLDHPPSLKRQPILSAAFKAEGS
jgi:hypothetical protein